MDGGETDVLVIGGGIIGLACAHYLQQRGRQVTVIDRGTIGGGCSHGNCGLICPSHVLPLAEPGAVAAGLKSLLRPSSPLRIKPRFAPQFWRWMWNFCRRCNERDMLAAARSLQPLLERSRTLYHRLMREEQLDSGWATRGLLFAFASAEAMEAYAATNRLLTEHFNLPAERLAGDTLAEREPGLKPGLAGGWYYPGDAQVRPDQLLSSWRARLAERGVRFIERCEFVEWIAAPHGGQNSTLVAASSSASPSGATGEPSAPRDDGRVLGRGPGRTVRAVATSQGTWTANAVVVAAGVWSARFAGTLGARLPLEPGKGYSITYALPRSPVHTPVILPERRVVFTPFEKGLRIGSIMEFAGFDSSLPPRRLNWLTSTARDFLVQPPPADAPAEPWFGWRPMTYDSLPVIDRSPRYDNVFVAAGHNMLGVTLAPATGELVASLVCGTRPEVEPEPYAIGRFG